MEVYQNYKKYREYVPEYKQWKEERNNQEAKRLEYIKRNPDAINKDDLQRSKALLHAIDVMDEYSQKNAEDMEVATEMAAGQAIEIVNIAGLGAGMLTMALPPVSKGLNSLSKKYPKLVFPIMMIPTAIGYVASIVASFPIMAWAAKTQVGASRQGRFEAMRKDLNNPNSFAVLTDEQLKQAQNDAQNITIPEENEKKDLINLGFKDVFKNLKKLVKKDKEYEKQRAEFDKKLKENEKHFNDSLSEKDIQKAKRDRQLLTKLVEKIDIASQDYAENVEMATNFANIAAIGSGFLTGWIANKILKLLKLNQAAGYAKAIPYVVGIGVSMVAAVYSAKIQKQASRIGRFKARQELMNNPDTLVYVDDEKASQIKDAKPLEEKKKPNIFKFLLQVIKDNKEYEQYKKTEGLKDKKLHKAIEKLQLTDEQLKEAKALQQNTFKTFNAVDEKSQTYAESVEALGQSIQMPVAMVGSLLGMGIGFLLNRKSMKNLKNLKDSQLSTVILNAVSKFVGGVVVGLLPVFALEYYITKEQKKASRVADMLAIKDLNDYRHFVDYNNLSNASVQPESTELTGGIKAVNKPQSLLEQLNNKYKEM